MQIGYLIKRSALRYKNKWCVIAGETKLTFQEVNERANRLANGLMGLGLKAGERACILLKNSTPYLEIYFALAKIGVARVPLHHRESYEEHAYKINNCQARVLLYGEEVSDFVSSYRSRLSPVEYFICVRTTKSPGTRGILDYGELIFSNVPAEPEIEIGEEVIYRMTHTGGTTGKAKPVITTHKTEFEFLTNMLLNVVPFHEDDVFLHVHLLSHGTACFILPCVVRGVTQVISPGTKPEQVLKTIEKEKVTSSFLVPATLIDLIHSPAVKQYNTRSLRRIIYGAAPMPVARIKEAIRIFGPIFGQIYGQAEIPVCATFLPPEEHIVEGPAEKVRKLASCGRETDRVEVRIVDENDRDLPVGEVGEIIARSNHMMVGYWNNPEETARVLKGGWVHTRDMGYMDEEGYVYLVDRKSDMIISGGFNIYPKEIEDVLYTHPAIREAAVFGIPDERLGEVVKAVVVFKPGQEATEEDLINYCSQYLGRYKIPRTIDISKEELPKTPVGKLDKKELKKPYWEGYERAIH